MIAVLGAGTMGKQLTVLFASHGYDVLLWNRVARSEISDEIKRIATIEVRRKTLPAGVDRDYVTGRIRVLDELSQIGKCELVVECVAENYGVKRELLVEASRLIDGQGILATNTSSLDLNILSRDIASAERFVGMHFFNPVTSIPLVEVGKTELTTERTVEAVDEFLKRIEKSPLHMYARPGFVVNRLLFAMINEAIVAAHDHAASIADIDSAMRLGLGHALGPLELADLVGLDICLAILSNLHRETGEDKFKPPPLLEERVAAGHLGRKTKQGFYSY